MAETDRSPSASAGNRTRSSAEEVLSGGTRKGRLRRLLPFLGPAFIACVAYVDPGNFATNIQGGSEFGLMLLWVILAANLMAMLLQSLSAKLGIATGKNLAEHCRERLPGWLVMVMWIVAEIAAMATDLAEFLGATLGFSLLLGLPLWIGVILTAISTVIILSLERFGFRPLEAVITALVGVIALAYVAEMVLVRPPLGQVALHSVVPQLAGSESLLLAVGIIGATVMPHVIFLHSSLTQHRIVVREPAKLKRLFRFEIADVVIAMGLAGIINMAMLIMASQTFFVNGITSIATIPDAYKTLQPLLGRASGWIFAVSLLASGLSSSSVGTMAGQVIMQGFVRRQIPAWIRRLVTMVPSILVIVLGIDPTRALVLSQVVLSFALPFPVISLVAFTRRKDLMGVLVNRRLTTVGASLAAVVILGLNVYLLIQAFAGG
ncbi:MAG TPA: Nramp family divalent metal transporter [Spirochaetia bacterium]|nr:Nramp family divalent metal transporter [Spirochaetia bacterium]